MSQQGVQRPPKEPILHLWNTRLLFPDQCGVGVGYVHCPLLNNQKEGGWAQTRIQLESTSSPSLHYFPPSFSSPMWCGRWLPTGVHVHFSTRRGEPGPDLWPRLYQHLKDPAWVYPLPFLALFCPLLWNVEVNHRVMWGLGRSDFVLVWVVFSMNFFSCLLWCRLYLNVHCSTSKDEARPRLLQSTPTPSPSSHLVTFYPSLRLLPSFALKLIM